MDEDDFFKNRPPSECKKCGNPYGFARSIPEYLPGAEEYGPGYTEKLKWRCRYCDYAVFTKTADADA